MLAKTTLSEFIHCLMFVPWTGNYVKPQDDVLSFLVSVSLVLAFLFEHAKQHPTNA